MSSPLHCHDCDKCKFVANVGDIDVYTCNGSMIARFSSDGPDYSSFPISLFRQMVKENALIGGVPIAGSSMPMRDYLCSEHVSNDFRAYLACLPLIE